MSSRKNKPPLALDMDFGEALRLFAKTDPTELPKNIKPKRLKNNDKTNKPNPID